MRVLGLISGTSHDGIDQAVVDFSQRDAILTGRLIASDCVAYDPALRARLLGALPPQPTGVAEVCQLDNLIGQAFAESAAAMVDRVGGVDLICSHGQTVYHWVDTDQALGSLQLGQPAWIAQRTGLPVVADLRARDITVGGQGAPLVALLDDLVLRHRAGPSAAVNLGGIANITVVGAGPVMAYDVGPANALIDAVVTARRLNPAGFDADGAIARSGTIDQALLSALLDDPYYSLPAPKSTGKEYFNASYVDHHLTAIGHPVSPADLVATLTELTVRTVAQAVSAAQVDYLALSGGGARNPVILTGLRQALDGVDVVLSDQLGLPADAKEAILMALIGWCTWHGLPATVPSATGARQPSRLGAIWPGTQPLVLPPPLTRLDGLRLVDSSDLVLRSAQIDDLAAVSAVFGNCWRQNYRGVLPDKLVDAMTDDWATSLWRRVLSTDPTSVTVALRHGQIIGLTRAVVTAGEGVVHSLYVAPAAQGGGVGTALLDGVSRDFARQGVSTARLWVFVANRAGVAFYRAHGWLPDGQVRVEDDFGEPELRLVKAVA